MNDIVFLISFITIVISNIIGFPKIATPSSTTLTNDEKAKIIKGCIIENFTIGTQWQKCIFYPSGALYSGYYMGMLVAQRNGFYRLYQYAINDTNNALTLYGNKYIDIDSGSNITISGLNKINSTYVSDIEALILYAKQQGWIN